MDKLSNRASLLRNAYAKSVSVSWRDRRRDRATNVYWTYGRRFEICTGPILQEFELFLSYWLFRELLHWVKTATFAANPLVLLALQVLWEVAVALVQWPLMRTEPPLLLSWLLSALTAASCRP